MKKLSISDRAKIVSIKIAEEIERIIDFFSLDMRKYGDFYSGPCPVHGGDSKLACNVYLNEYREKPPMWICFSHQCENVFYKDMFGFFRGILSRHLLNWSQKGDPTAGVCDTFDFLKKEFDIEVEDFGFVSVPKTGKNFIISTELFFGVNHKEEKMSVDISSLLEIPSKFFLEQGFSEETLKFFSVGDCSVGNFSDRAVVPVFGENDQDIVGLSGRSFSDSKQKWKHSKGFTKSRYLYNQKGAFHVGVKKNVLFIVEGPKDVWRMYEAGYKNTVALFGVSISDSQQVLLEKSGIMNIHIFLDNDAAGEKGYEKIKKALKRSFNVYKVNNPYIGKDPSDFTIEELQLMLVDTK